MSGAVEDSTADAGQGGISTPSNLSSQKRPRDYGEQLKGLSESDDEGMHYGEPSPAPKKQKTDRSGGDDDSDLDDGEIIESSPAQPSNVFIPQNAQHATQNAATSLLEPNSALNALSETQVLDAKTHEPSEDGEIDSNMADDFEKPFFIDTTGTTGTTPLQHSGWNQGVSVGARTSFGKPATQLFPENTPRTQTAPSSVSSLQIHEANEEDDDRDEEDPKNGDHQPPQSPTIDWFKDVKPETRPPLTFSVGGVAWNLRRQAFRVKKRNLSDMKAFWNARLLPWIIALAEENEGMADRITVEVVTAGFTDHANRKGTDSLLMGISKHISKLRPVVREVLENADLVGLILKAQNSLRKKQAQASKGKTTGKKANPIGGSTLKAAPPLAEKNTQGDVINIEDDSDSYVSNVGARKNALNPDEELRLQQRYYPFAEDPSIFCIRCSGVGHKANECPQLQCKFCGSKEHGNFACPTRRRCSRCRQLGHSFETCNEKLALAPGEQNECAFCGEEHPDEQCTEIWRSYKVVLGQQKKVKDIPAFCYTCGGSGHYGPECHLPDKGGKATEHTSWSQMNRDLYVDTNSEDTALAWANVNTNPSFENDIRIRGTAQRRVHTHFVSSDESDDDFIRPRIRVPEHKKPFKVHLPGLVDNRGRGTHRNYDQSRRRQNEREFSPPPPPPPNAQGNGGTWQPPLPPGPPPRNRNERPLAPPPGSLPPRPQTYDSRSSRGGSNNQGGQNNNRGGRGGFRGGSRGNSWGGKGRGRGK